MTRSSADDTNLAVERLGDFLKHRCPLTLGALITGPILPCLEDLKNTVVSLPYGPRCAVLLPKFLRPSSFTMYIPHPRNGGELLPCHGVLPRLTTLAIAGQERALDCRKQTGDLAALEPSASCANGPDHLPASAEFSRKVGLTIALTYPDR
ncbi:hypothetical protein K438DRAFT_2009281 [Mycena galopus ATCC 62051]|nr:hypothetical protein K438DRAFT_2009281 [Mycena galopus ATCC 62051]